MSLDEPLDADAGRRDDRPRASGRQANRRSDAGGLVEGARPLRRRVQPSPVKLWLLDNGGIASLAVGTLIAINGLTRGTTVESGFTSVHNIGLLTDKICTVVFGCTLMIVGAIFHALKISKTPVD